MIKMPAPRPSQGCAQERAGPDVTGKGGRQVSATVPKSNGRTPHAPDLGPAGLHGHRAHGPPRCGQDMTSHPRRRRCPWQGRSGHSQDCLESGSRGGPGLGAPATTKLGGRLPLALPAEAARGRLWALPACALVRPVPREHLHPPAAGHSARSLSPAASPPGLAVQRTPSPAPRRHRPPAAQLPRPHLGSAALTTRAGPRRLCRWPGGSAREPRGAGLSPALLAQVLVRDGGKSKRGASESSPRACSALRGAWRAGPLPTRDSTPGRGLEERGSQASTSPAQEHLPEVPRACSDAGEERADQARVPVSSRPPEGTSPPHAAAPGRDVALPLPAGQALSRGGGLVEGGGGGRLPWPRAGRGLGGFMARPSRQARGLLGPGTIEQRPSHQELSRDGKGTAQARDRELR